MDFHSLNFRCFLFILLLHPLGSTAGRKPRFDSIYQFGDSVSDTGNFIRENSTSDCSSLPYGETLFHRPTGRCSDGFLIIDFVAKAFHLPLLNPYLNRDANFIHGVNFAVSGSTALDSSTLALKNITGLSSHSSLSIQLEWFKTHLKSLCSSKQECKHRLRKALFLAGPIGANDYYYALLGGKSVENLYELVPDVIHIIKFAVNEIVAHGATKVVVPGYFHIGCVTFILVNFASNDKSTYDEFNCIKIINEFGVYHNLKLQDAIKELQHQHPRVSISYGDTYSAFTWLLQNSASLGFEQRELYKTCCGDGNNVYNFNSSRFCGIPGVRACRNPKKRINWDGLHLTHQAHKYLADWLLEHSIKGI